MNDIQNQIASQGPQVDPNVVTSDNQLLKIIGAQIQKDLQAQKKNVEWLSKEADLARSTLREIIAGRSNLRILSLASIVDRLGYKSIFDFFKVISR